MTTATLLLLCGAVFAVAFLYSSVGHAGASGYIAVMALAGLSPGFIRPTALTLNILVAVIASCQFYRAGHFSWRVFWPFAVLAVPCAFLGGMAHLPSRIFNVVLGLALLYSAFHFFRAPRAEGAIRSPALPAALAIGAALGLVSGLVGVGGGIFLTPLLIIARWAPTKTASAVSALFILVNSIAGLAGTAATSGHPPALALPLAVAVIAGGSLGAYLGSRRFSAVAIKKLLAVVLTIAAIKLLFA